VNAVTGGDSGVLDRVDFDVEKLMSRKKQMGPIYRVLLHNDNVNRRDYVVKVLIKVVDGFQEGDAFRVMEEAHEMGIALVTACVQETAEEYCEQLRNHGLTSSIEPEGGSNGGFSGGPGDN